MWINYCACYQAAQLDLYPKARHNNLKCFPKFSFSELNFVFHYLIWTPGWLLQQSFIVPGVCVESRIE